MIKKQQRLFNFQSGQTLLEMLLAFSVSMLSLSAVALGVITSLNNAQYTKNQNLANSYAREVLDVARQKRDSGWDEFTLYNGTYCVPENNKFELYDNYNCSIDGKVGIFTRKITLLHDNQGECYPCDNQGSPGCETGLLAGSKAVVTVLWTDGKCQSGNAYCHKVELSTCFSNIDQRENIEERERELWE
jgi:type II secretory pathway pseudopilin PulG